MASQSMKKALFRYFKILIVVIILYFIFRQILDQWDLVRSYQWRINWGLLILSLACTPINTIFGFRQVLKVRRPLGLYAFMYASIHFLIFIGLDYEFDLVLLQEAIFDKRYALVGFAAGLILLVLALTSTRGWMKRLGKTWARIHRFVYLAGILVIIHYLWLVKSDIRVPLLYGGVVLVLLVARIPFVRKHLSRIRQHGLVRTINQLPGKLRSKLVANSFLGLFTRENKVS